MSEALLLPPPPEIGELPPVNPILINPNDPDIHPLYEYFAEHILPDGVLSGVRDPRPEARRAIAIARISGLGLIQIPIGLDKSKEAIHIFPSANSLPLVEQPHDHTSELEIVRCIGPGWEVHHTVYEPTTGSEGELFRRMANTRVLDREGRVHFIDTPLSEIRMHSTTDITAGPAVVGETIKRGVIHALQPHDIGIHPKGSVISFVNKTNHAESITTSSHEDWADEHRLSPQDTDTLAAAIAKLEDKIRAGILLNDSGEPIDAAGISRTTMVYLRPEEYITQTSVPRKKTHSAGSYLIGDRLAHGKVTLEQVAFGTTISLDIGGSGQDLATAPRGIYEVIRTHIDKAHGLVRL